MPRTGDWADDRIGMVSFLLWLHRHGHIGGTLGEATAVMVAPHSWEDEWRAMQAEIEAENAELDAADNQHVLP